MSHLYQKVLKVRKLSKTNLYLAGFRIFPLELQEQLPVKNPKMPWLSLKELKVATAVMHFRKTYMYQLNSRSKSIWLCKKSLANSYSREAIFKGYSRACLNSYEEWHKNTVWQGKTGHGLKGHDSSHLIKTLAEWHPHCKEGMNRQEMKNISLDNKTVLESGYCGPEIRVKTFFGTLAKF